MDNTLKNKEYVLVTGATGQLGYDVVNELNYRRINNIGVGSFELDITNKVSVENYFKTHNISKVIHCAAYTKVDMAEEEKDLNIDINVNGTRNLVDICKSLNLPLMFFSTDYVFGGEGTIPFKEDDNVNPLCEYAKAKLEAEKIVSSLRMHYILRISWVFGKNGNNFIKTMLKLSNERKEISVVSDQIGSPTYTKDAAKISVDILLSDKYGIYNVTNEGYVSWSDFAREIFKLSGKNVTVNDILSEDYNAKARRPKNSRLDKSKLILSGFYKLPTWQDALKRYLKEISE